MSGHDLALLRCFVNGWKSLRFRGLMDAAFSDEGALLSS
jgi:hypothetical protein